MPTQIQPSPDWYQYLWGLFGLLAGGLITWVLKGFSVKDLLAWWNRPRLSIVISDPVQSEAETVVPSDDGPPVNVGKHRFYHFDVANSGRTAAISCEAELVAVDMEETGKRNTVPSSTNLCFLHWARTDPDCVQIDIPGRISRARPSTRMLDLCTQKTSEPGCLHIFRGGCTGHADGLRTQYGPGTYYFTVCVRSKEPLVHPVTIEVRVHVDDSGQPFRIQRV